MLSTTLFAAIFAFTGDPTPSPAIPPISDLAGLQVGKCEEGHLSGAVQLPESPQHYVRITPENAWGRREMIDVLVHAGKQMEWLMPEADPFTVGDISARYGGQLSGHRSHRLGIDADIGVYWRDAWQPRGEFVNLHPREFDTEATWTLLQSMLNTGLISRVLLDQSLINKLYDYTVESGELTIEEADAIFPPQGARVWEMSGIVTHAPSHADHLHVTVLCGG
jgi:hypothetical protein